MTKPNLFDFATSELSQDAFLCWLFSWITHEVSQSDGKLQEISINLLKKLFEKHNKPFPTKIEKFVVLKQYKNIDILLTVNDEIAIPIEDKIGTTDHCNKLLRYLEILKNDGWKNENLLPIYLQTGEQGDYTEVKKAGFVPFLRSDLLQVLRDGSSIKNNIFMDYLEYLENIEKQVQSYKNLHLQDWNWYSWQGFFTCLQEKIGEASWGYVPTPSGGFLGFWWHWHNDEESEQYLQLEQNKLCFKISVDDHDKRKDLKYKWYGQIIEAGKGSQLKLIKPTLRNGQWMTVCVLDGDYRQSNIEGIIDIEKSILVLTEAQNILDKAVQLSNFKNQ